MLVFTSLMHYTAVYVASLPTHKVVLDVINIYHITIFVS
jgi:hypothetical protein